MFILAIKRTVNYQQVRWVGEYCRDHEAQSIQSFVKEEIVFDLMCICNPGFTGKNCETEYIPCNPSPCLNDGFCKEIDSLTYQCKCPPDSQPYLCARIHRFDGLQMTSFASLPTSTIVFHPKLFLHFSVA
ncbi:hypothetical protein RUM44_013348 [Polyplax serrata]|uniref:EGF-like domain-containing protein n=1 Tax=Polyplax serrata TaxID=468196 RepID=A0ABR1BIM7_POLSC